MEGVFGSGKKIYGTWNHALVTRETIEGDLVRKIVIQKSLNDDPVTVYDREFKNKEAVDIKVRIKKQDGTSIECGARLAHAATTQSGFRSRTGTSGVPRDGTSDVDHGTTHEDITPPPGIDIVIAGPMDIVEIQCPSCKQMVAEGDTRVLRDQLHRPV